MDALALLALQIDWGADEALAGQPVNRLSTAAPPLRSAAPAQGAASHQPIPPIAARTLDARTLEEWHAAVRAFTGCTLRETATNPVLATGEPWGDRRSDPAGRLLIIGEPPVAEDDRSGRPFSGAAGQVLDRILAALGLKREKVLLAPLIPWRPPGNRPPTDAELAQCLPLLHRLIVLSAPRYIVLTGILPVRALLGSAASLRRLRGRWAELSVPDLENPIQTLPTFSLANLKTATERHDAWADWRMLNRDMQAGKP